MWLSRKIACNWDSNLYKNIHSIYFVGNQIFPQDEELCKGQKLMEYKYKNHEARIVYYQ